jgi:hypothetical protein
MGSDRSSAAATTIPDHGATMDHFEASILSSLRSIYDRLPEERLPDDQKHLEGTDFSTFLKGMAAPSNNIMHPAPVSNLDLPLSAYFISASHNTYLMGHQLYGSATVDGYKSVSELFYLRVQPLEG